MTELLTAAQMRALEQAAIESDEVTGLELMERAGRGVVEAIFEEWPELAERAEGGAAPPPAAPESPRSISGRMKSAIVLCGPGNNGGDGFVVARLLHERGWAVELFLFGDPGKLPPDARVNYERWLELGSVTALKGAQQLKARAVPDLFVDAVFGTGLSRRLEGQVALVVGAFGTLREALGTKVVAVDIPSGICADSGKPLGAFPVVDLTVTFHARKVGHHLERAGEYSGKLVVKDIGLNPGPPALAAEGVRLVEAVSARRMSKAPGGHKYANGHALILSGGSGRSGAARLAARGALRIGAGLVTLGVPPSAQMEVASQITALMLQRIEGADGLAEVLRDGRLNALCLGPGLGPERARELVPVALKARRATVLDADALSAFADDPEGVFSLLHENCVLTPHGGEFARLFPDIAAKLNETPTKGPAYSKIDATREAAKRAGCVVLFKGPDTVIAAPDGRCSVNSAHYGRSAPWLATAGSGDVLAGFITGLMARGVLPIHAAEIGAWLHVGCALEFGPGLIAEDLPEQIPAVFRALGLS